MPEKTIEKRRRVGTIQSILMIGIAIAIDIINIILVLVVGIGIIANRFITLFVFMVFAFWFALNGVSFLTGRMSMQKMFRFFGPAFGEMIPVIGALPLWTIGIWLTLRSVKKEDEIA
jgi:Kef-type K+ transport system membrane component KefB